MAKILDDLVPKPTDPLNYGVAATLSLLLLGLWPATPLAIWANEGQVTFFLGFVLFASFIAAIMASALALIPLGLVAPLGQVLIGALLCLSVFFTFLDVAEGIKHVRLGHAFGAVAAALTIWQWAVVSYRAFSPQVATVR